MLDVNEIIQKLDLAVKLKFWVRPEKVEYRNRKLANEVQQNTQEIINVEIPEGSASIINIQQQYEKQTVQLENQRQKDAITLQLQAQQGQETDMATTLGTNLQLEQCAGQTKDNLRELNNIDLSTKDAATQLATIATHVEKTQAQLDQLAQNNDQKFSNAVQKDLEADNQTIKEEQNEDNQAEEYEESLNTTE